MSITLHLGVIEKPYDNKGAPTTTGQVASWLENEYHVMQIFTEIHREQIENHIAESLAGALETLLSGNSVSLPDVFDSMGTAKNEIAAEFHGFLEKEEMNGRPGIPTKAALDGINHRFKNPVTGIRRPSFIDTGLYVNSFAVEITR